MLRVVSYRQSKRGGSIGKGYNYKRYVTQYQAEKIKTLLGKKALQHMDAKMFFKESAGKAKIDWNTKRDVPVFGGMKDAKKKEGKVLEKVEKVEGGEEKVEKKVEKVGFDLMTVEQLEEVLRAGEDPKAYFYHAKACFEKGEYDKAKYDFMRLIEEEDYRVEWYSNAGVCAALAGDYLDSISFFEKGIDISPKRAELYRKKGMINFLLGYDDRALSDYMKVVELSGGDDELDLLISDLKIKDIENIEEELFKGRDLGGGINDHHLELFFPGINDEEPISLFDKGGIFNEAKLQREINRFSINHHVDLFIASIDVFPEWSSRTKKLALDVLHYKHRTGTNPAIIVIILDLTSGKVEFLASSELNDLLPNFKCKKIVADIMPTLREGKYDKAISQALSTTKSMMGDKDYFSSRSRGKTALYLLLAVALAAFIFLYLGKRQSHHKCRNCGTNLIEESNTSSNPTMQHLICPNCGYKKAIPNTFKAKSYVEEKKKEQQQQKVLN